MNFIEKSIKNEIMATDVYVCVADEVRSFAEIEADVNASISTLREFAKNYSRFLSDNELSEFNLSQGTIKVSQDLFEMLTLSKKYFALTDGIFDICTLPDLIKEGYVLSKKDGFYKETDDLVIPRKFTTADLKLSKLTVTKPEDLKIDLGGIGKGYIIQKITTKLSEKYTNFIVDAGGDMYVAGKDLKNNYEFWGIDIENPLTESDSLALLTVSNMGVATSGVNKRKWKIADGADKNHIIDTKTGGSLDNDLLTVTVVSKTAVESDVLAKSILVMGLKEGRAFAEKNKVASFIVDKTLQLYTSTEMEKYVWKN